MQLAAHIFIWCSLEVFICYILTAPLALKEGCLVQKSMKKISSGVLKSFWILIATYARKFMQILDFYAQIWSLHGQMDSQWSTYLDQIILYTLQGLDCICIFCLAQYRADGTWLSKALSSQYSECFIKPFLWLKREKKSKESILLPQLQSTLNELPSSQCTAQSSKGKKNNKTKHQKTNTFVSFWFIRCINNPVRHNFFLWTIYKNENIK